MTNVFKNTLAKGCLFLSLLTALAVPACAESTDRQDSTTKVETGRSVAIDTTQHKYWLSDDLNRLFLVQPQTSTASDGTPTNR